MNLVSKLEELGLSKKEALVYLAGIELGPTSAAALAKHSKIKRGTIYEIIDRLREKGLFSEIKKNARRRFVAADPNVLKIQQNDRDRVLEHIFPLLRDISNVTHHKPAVHYHNTIEEIKRTFIQLLEEQPENSEILDVASIQAEEDLGPDWVHEFATRRAQKRIQNRCITERFKDLDFHLDQNDTVLREIKLFPNVTKTNIHLMVFDEKVYLTSYKEQPMGLLIIDKKIADSMRMIFEVMWMGLPKIDE